MSLSSDISIDPAKFQPSAISQETRELNEQLLEIMDGAPRWYEVGAPKYREMRKNGETPLPKPVLLDSGKTSSLPSREKGRDIPTRIFLPENGQSRGVFMHIHGGGWVLMTEEVQDPLLKFIADSAHLTVISVGYRLAPEDPFPAGPEDCYDAAEYLVDSAKKDYGAELLFVGGESAGAHLSSLVCFHLLDTRPSFAFAGLVLHFGAFDLSGFLPQVHHFSKTLILDMDIMEKYIMAFLPDSTSQSRRDPSVSPFYADLVTLSKKAKNGRLPPALFTCGTEDCLLDDTIMMSIKWQMANAECTVKIYPGAPHGFIAFSPEISEAAGEGREAMKAFLLAKIG